MGRRATAMRTRSALLPLVLCVGVAALLAAAQLETIPFMEDCAGLANTTADFLTLNDPAPGCRKKLTVRFTVDNNLLGGRDWTLSYQSAVGPGGWYDAHFFEEFFVRVVRREVVVRHRLSYLGKFNAKPYEVPTSDPNCNVDFNPNTATCGLAKADDGTFVPLSQGFCCDCALCHNASCILGARADSCFAPSTQVASCLRMNYLDYNGYSIDPIPEVSYVLDVQVWGNASEFITDNVFSLRRLNTSLTVSPDYPQRHNATDQIIVMFEDSTVNQNLQGAAVRRNITGKYVFMPSTPATDDRVRAGSSEWLFLDPSAVTLDGLACDKVGTSYKAFAVQQNACRAKVGSCLGNQLEDFRAMDLVMTGMGMSGGFLGPNYGSFTFQEGPDSAAYLAYPSTVPPPDAMLNIIRNGDRLPGQFSAAEGEISALYLTSPEDAHVPADKTRGDSRESAGVLIGGVAVEVRRLASFPSFYKVTMDTCSKLIQQDALYPLWVVVGEGSPTQNVTFLLQTTPDAPTNAYVSCRVHLWDYNGHALQTKTFTWGLTHPGFVPQLPGLPGGDGDGDGSGDDDPCDSCGLFTVARTFRQRCVKFIVADVLLLCGPVVLLLVVCFRCAFCGCLRKKEKSSSRGCRGAGQREEANARRRHSPHYDSCEPPAPQGGSMGPAASPSQQQQQQQPAARPPWLEEQYRHIFAQQQVQQLYQQQAYAEQLKQQQRAAAATATAFPSMMGRQAAPSPLPPPSAHGASVFGVRLRPCVVEEVNANDERTGPSAQQAHMEAVVEDVVPLQNPGSQKPTSLEDIDEDVPAFPNRSSNNALPHSREPFP